MRCILAIIATHIVLQVKFKAYSSGMLFM